MHDINWWGMLRRHLSLLHWLNVLSCQRLQYSEFGPRYSEATVDAMVRGQCIKVSCYSSAL